jgi:hypothetical protein
MPTLSFDGPFGGGRLSGLVRARRLAQINQTELAKAATPSVGNFRLAT